MSFIPHTEADLGVMLEAVGLESADDLFSVVPEELHLRGRLEGIPGPLTEPEIVATFETIAAANRTDLVCFAGGGAYDTYVPAAVEALASRSEFVTAYTPYQPEVSQGVLQALFEYQTLVCRLTGMEIANASLYDGASATVEAANLAAAATGRDSVVVSEGVNPRIRDVLATFGEGPGHSLAMAPIEKGTTSWGEPAEPAALVVQQPNYLGCIEDVAAAAEQAHAAGALLVVLTDPIANGLLRRPGDDGADVVVAEGQALGGRLNYGGPGLGIFATRDKHLRLVPGRIAGETVDADGRRAYTLAMQGREQHIRREKASSNVCTNQTLMAITSAIALSWLGPAGLRHVAESSARKAHYLAQRLDAIPGCKAGVGAAFFREFVLELPVEASAVLGRLVDEGFIGGIALRDDYPALGEAILVSVTEQRTREQLDRYVGAIERVIGQC